MGAWNNLFDLPLIAKVKASLIHIEHEIRGIYTGAIDVLDLKGGKTRQDGVKWLARRPQRLTRL